MVRVWFVFAFRRIHCRARQQEHANSSLIVQDPQFNVVCIITGNNLSHRSGELTSSAVTLIQQDDISFGRLFRLWPAYGCEPAQTTYQRPAQKSICNPRYARGT